MKKMLLALILVLAMAIPAFAGQTITYSASASSGAMVSSGTFGNSVSFGMAGNTSYAGVDVKGGNNSGSVTTTATSAGGTASYHGITLQTGSAFATGSVRK
jgi:hypothetical protein